MCTYRLYHSQQQQNDGLVRVEEKISENSEKQKTVNILRVLLHNILYYYVI